MEDTTTKLSKGKAFLVPMIIMIVIGLVLFLPAGSLKFWEAWIWWTIISATTLYITAYFLKKDPVFLSRRMKVKEKEKLPGIINLLSFLSLLVFIVLGFDYRFHWSTVPVWIIITANAMVFMGYVFIFLLLGKIIMLLLSSRWKKNNRLLQPAPTLWFAIPCIWDC